MLYMYLFFSSWLCTVLKKEKREKKRDKTKQHKIILFRIAAKEERQLLSARWPERTDF